MPTPQEDHRKPGVEMRRVGDAAWRWFQSQKGAANAFGIAQSEVSRLIHKNDRVAALATRFEARFEDSTVALVQANIPAPSQDSSVSPHSISGSCRHKVKEPQRKRGPHRAFPQKLFEMVSRHADVITFENSTLVVLDKARLTTEFNYRSFQSFTRQLNYYGFVRDKKRADFAYVHPSAAKVEDLVTLVRKDLSTFPEPGRSLTNRLHFLLVEQIDWVLPPTKRSRAESLENLNDAARCLVSFTRIKAVSGSNNDYI